MQKAYAEALEELKERSKNLKAGDFSGRIDVEFIGGDKFKIFYVLIEEDNDFLYVWTEHFGHFVWFKEDIKKWKYTK